MARFLRHNYNKLMNEKQAILQLKKLRAIKPAKDWAFLVKKDLLAEPIDFQEKPAKYNSKRE